ncbi:MAG: hypothetical protein ABW168_04070 [Sedimenticola sp.]
MVWLADPVWGGLSGLIAFVALVFSGYQYWQKRRTAADKPSDIGKFDVHQLVVRLIVLFKAHGISRTQISRFLGSESDILLEDLADDEKLIKKLDDELLDVICDRFAVQREWLDGETDHIYSVHDFYKCPEEFSVFLDSLLERNPDEHIQGCVYRAKQPSRLELDTLIVIQEPIGWIGDKEIVRYHLCGEWVYGYWKARAYLAACVAIAWSKGIHFIGKDVPTAWIEQLVKGKVFVDDEGLSVLGRWYPDDLALKPEEFLLFIDEEFGLEAGLQLWLELDKKDWMTLGESEIYQGVRERFQEALQQ